MSDLPSPPPPPREKGNGGKMPTTKTRYGRAYKPFENNLLPPRPPADTLKPGNVLAVLNVQPLLTNVLNIGRKFIGMPAQEPCKKLVFCVYDAAPVISLPSFEADLISLETRIRSERLAWRDMCSQARSKGENVAVMRDDFGNALTFESTGIFRFLEIKVKFNADGSRVFFRKTGFTQPNDYFHRGVRDPNEANNLNEYYTPILYTFDTEYAELINSLISLLNNQLDLIPNSNQMRQIIVSFDLYPDRPIQSNTQDRNDFHFDRNGIKIPEYVSILHLNEGLYRSTDFMANELTAQNNPVVSFPVGKFYCSLFDQELLLHGTPCAVAPPAERYSTKPYARGATSERTEPLEIVGKQKKINQIVSKHEQTYMQDPTSIPKRRFIRLWYMTVVPESIDADMSVWSQFGEPVSSNVEFEVYSADLRAACSTTAAVQEAIRKTTVRSLGGKKYKPKNKTKHRKTHAKKHKNTRKRLKNKYMQGGEPTQNIYIYTVPESCRLNS